MLDVAELGEVGGEELLVDAEIDVSNVELGGAGEGIGINVGLVLGVVDAEVAALKASNGELAVSFLGLLTRA